MSSRLLAIVIALGTAVCVPAGGAQPLRAPALPGHAHNDYLHPRPLADALAAGYCSIEVDVFAADGRLRVAHTAAEIVPGNTLEKLYLAPLDRLLRVDGDPCPDSQLLLLVDFKSAAGPTLDALLAALTPYRLAAVRFVISGDRPWDRAADLDSAGLAFDGRLSDLEERPGDDDVPLISDSWSRHFGWAGDGPFPADERRRLEGVVATAHAQGRLLRFWSVPHRQEVWRELLAAGVDLVSVDDLEAFAAAVREGAAIR